MIDILQLLWSKRKKILKTTGSFILLGVIIAVFSPVEYETTATMMPESQSSQGTAGSLLQQYGGILGLSGSFDIGSEGNIPTQLYPNIVQSLPYQVELMGTPIRFNSYDTTTTAYSFFTEIHSPTLLGYLKKYTIGLPGQIMKLFRNKEKTNLPVRHVNPDTVLSLSEKQIQVVNILRERVLVTLGEQSGVITLTATMPDAQAAAELGQAGIRLLKEYMREYRTQKAMEDLEFVREQTNDARGRFKKAQARLAQFRDSNVSLATAKAQTQEQELQAEYDLAFNLYNSLNQRLEQAKLSVQEQTPVFSILQPIHVPLQKSSPNRTLILIVSFIIGFIISIAWIIVGQWWDQEELRKIFE